MLNWWVCGRLLREVDLAELRLSSAERARPENPAGQEEVLEAKEGMVVQLERLRCFDHKKY